MDKLKRLKELKQNIKKEYERLAADYPSMVDFTDKSQRSLMNSIDGLINFWEKQNDE